jgi:hypothetical protein
VRSVGAVARTGDQIHVEQPLERRLRRGQRHRAVCRDDRLRFLLGRRQASALSLKVLSCRPCNARSAVRGRP